MCISVICPLNIAHLCSLILENRNIIWDIFKKNRGYFKDNFLLYDICMHNILLSMNLLEPNSVPHKVMVKFAYVLLSLDIVCILNGLCYYCLYACIISFWAKIYRTDSVPHKVTIEAAYILLSFDFTCILHGLCYCCSYACIIFEFLYIHIILSLVGLLRNRNI